MTPHNLATYDELELREMAEAPLRVFDRLPVPVVAIYLAHIYQDRPVKEIARQAMIPPRDVETLVKYVQAHLAEEMRTFTEE